MHARELISDDEWEELRKTADLACRKYPLDDMARENRKKVDRAYLMRLAKEDDDNCNEE